MRSNECINKRCERVAQLFRVVLEVEIDKRKKRSPLRCC